MTEKTEKAPGKLGKLRAVVEAAHPFKILEAAFTAVALVAVVVTVGPSAGAQIGVSGGWSLALGGAIAVTLDLLWVGAMRQLGRAIWQRHRSGIIAMGIVSVLATAASTALMIGIGHAGPFAYLPGLALAATGLRIYVDNAFATRSRARGIFEREAGDRDERAQAEADTRHAVASIETQAIRLVAEDNARATAHLALAEQRVAAQVAQNKRYAELEKTLQVSETAVGQAAEAFRARRLTDGLEQRLALPVWGPSVTLPTPAAPADRAALGGGAETLRAPAVEQDTEGGADGRDQHEQAADDEGARKGFTPGRQPAFSDAELYLIGRKVFTAMAPPRSKKAFRNLVTSQTLNGRPVSAGRERLDALYEQLREEFGQDVEEPAEESSEQ